MASANDKTIGLTQTIREMRTELGSVESVVKNLDKALGSTMGSARVEVSNLTAALTTLKTALKDVENSAKYTSGGGNNVQNAAATSASLGFLTGGGGRGGGGGGGGFGTNAGASSFGNSLFNPRTWIPNLAGKIGSFPFGLSGALLRRVPGLKRIGGLIGGAGGIAGSGAAIATGMAMDAGLSYMHQAVNSNLALEDMARFTTRDSLYNGGLLPFGDTPGEFSGYSYGYDPYETFRLTGQLQHSSRVSKPRAKHVGRFLQSQSLLGKLGIPISDMTDVYSVLAAGGVTAGENERLGASVIKSVGDAGLKQREASLMLGNVGGALNMQLGRVSTLNSEHVKGAVNLQTGLMGAGFDLAKVRAVMSNLMNGVSNPGGGASGEVALMQAMGWGMPNMDAFNKTAKSMGIDKTFFPTSYFKAKKMMENPLQHIDRLLTSARFIGGESKEQQAMVLSELTGLSLTDAETVVSSRSLPNDLQKQLASGRVGRNDLSVSASDRNNLRYTQQELRLKNIPLSEYNNAEFFAANEAITDARVELAKLVQTAITPLSVATTGFFELLGSGIEGLNDSARALGDTVSKIKDFFGRFKVTEDAIVFE